MFCKWCGTENTNDARFCSQCGKEITVSENQTVHIAQPVVQQKPPKKNNKVIFIILGTVLALAIAVAAFFIHQKQQEKKYNENVELGMKYLEEQEYEKAEAALLAAIKVEPKEIRLYQGLADAYIGMNDYDNAADVYEDAMVIVDEEYDKTDNIMDDGEELYKEAIEFYHNQEWFDKVIELINRLLNMTEDEELIEELQESQIYLGRYPAYIELMEKYMTEYGEGSVESINEDVYNEGFCFTSGLCVARLFDFNNDGMEELLVAYAKKFDYEMTEYVVEVWDYKDGELVKVYEGEPLTTGGPSIEVSVYYADNAPIYIREGWIGYTVDYHLCGYDGETFERTYSYKMDDLSDYDTGYTNWVYSINGEEVSDSEWMYEMNRWDNYYTIDHYLMGTREYLSPSIKACYNTYRELLDAVENYKFSGVSDETENAVSAEILIEWDGCDDDGALMNLVVNMEGTLSDGSQIFVSNERTEAYNMSGDLVAVYEDIAPGEIKILLYGELGSYTLEGYDGNLEPGSWEGTLWGLNGTATVKIPGQEPVVFKSEEGILRSYTGVKLWGICSISDGYAMKYDSSWIDEVVEDQGLVW